VKSKLESEFKDKPMQYYLLKYLCQFLKDVSERSSENRMNIHNLSVVFTPNMIRAEEVTTTAYANIPESQQLAMADAAIYLKQMNQGMVLVQLLIAKCNDIFVC
jgi:hypothetical protein